MKIKNLIFILILSCKIIYSQINIVPNSSFESFTACPTFGAQWNNCSNWNNVNMNIGVGLWGTPDYYNACGSGGTSPPSTFSGYSNVNTGVAMMGVVPFNNGYPNYREYLSTQLNCLMTASNTYTVSFWITNGQVQNSPYVVKNMGIHFSNTALSQTGYGIIPVIPQIEVTSYIASTTWVNYTFTITPTSNWQYITFGNYRTDAVNSPSLGFSVPGGPASAYSYYFIDDIQVLAQLGGTFSLTPTIAQATTCGGASSATVTPSNNTLTLNYTWLPGGYTTTVVNNLPAGVYTVSATNAACNNAVTQFTINPTPALNVTITAATPSACLGNTIGLSANAIGGVGALNYLWSNGANTITTNTTQLTGGSYIYTLTVNDAGSCIITKTIALNFVPNPTLSTTNTTICAGQTAVLVANGATTYTWSSGNTTPTINVTPTTTTIYTVVGAMATCTTQAQSTVNVYATPQIIGSNQNNVLCNGNSNGTASVIISSGTPTYNFVWSTLPVQTTAGATGLSAGMYTVTVVDANNCTTKQTFTITQPPLLTLTITATTPSACVGNTIGLIANAVGGFGTLNYLWSNGANTITTNTTQLTGGNYNYTLTVNDANSCITTKTIALNFVPNPTLSTTNTTICAGQTAVLVANGATTYTWSSGNTTPTINVTPTTTTIYTVVGAMATCTTQAQSTVNVNATPQIIDSNQSNVLCNGNSNGTASVIVSSGTPTYNFVWSTLPVQTTAGASGLGAGMYTVTVVDANNCTAKQTFTITQPQPLTLAINTPTTCKNTPTVITANVSGGTANYNYTWQLGNYTGNTILVNATNTNYTLNVIDANNCVITGTTAVSVATIMANFNYLINPCDKYLVTTNTSSNAINYNWSLGDNSSSININPTHTYVSGGNYTLSLIATNSFGCKDTLKKVIQINSADCDSTIFGIAKAASISIVHNDLYTITFKVIAVNSATSNLSNVSLFDDLTTVFAAPSTFTVISAPQLLSNNSALAVNPLFNGVNSTNLLMPTTSTLMANKKDTLAFTIQFSSNKNCGPFKNIITGNATTKLNFLVSDASQNGSNVDSDGDGNPKNNNEPTPITLPFCDLFVPDAFSPNGDGKNEVFVINGLNCRSIKLTVFNRWGSKVYEHNNYDNSWNGSASVKNTFSGNALLPQGTYYYILEYTDGDKEVKTGFVVLQY